jgi:hypothetical protein
LLKCAKRIRHKLNKLMKSSPIYNKLQHYLIEPACMWIFLTLICVNWTRTENEERNGREGLVGMLYMVLLLVKWVIPHDVKYDIFKIAMRLICLRSFFLVYWMGFLCCILLQWRWYDNRLFWYFNIYFCLILLQWRWYDSRLFWYFNIYFCLILLQWRW